jgi:L-lactate dehydrogenase complex protein LldE
MPMVRRFVEVFAGYDAIVAPSGSCVAMVRESYPKLLPEAAGVAERTYELSELLVDVLGVTDVGASFPHRVTYHPTCHGLRLLHLGDRPERLLRAVAGLDLVTLPGADECCGFGGTFAVKNSGVSGAMLADKCHIGGGLSRRGDAVRAMHYAEILAEGESS